MTASHEVGHKGESVELNLGKMGCWYIIFMARTTDEPRYLVIGRIGSRHWSAVITYRDERVRLISVRRARSEEVALYENESI